jgi:uncharacterized protein (AIM24 family)
MTTINNLLGSGNSGLSAAATTGILTNNVTATGNSQGTALLFPSDMIICTTVAASTGVILPSGAQGAKGSDWYTAINHGASTLSVYPPTGGKIANGSVNAAFSVAANKTAFLLCIDGTNWAASLSA